jgi:outer membrane lipoprotein
MNLNQLLALTIIGAVTALTGCATGTDLNTKGVDEALTAQHAHQDIKQATGRRVLWGGMIMGATNLKDRTVIEVLAFPLDSDHRPNSEATATVRFLAEHIGYLELIDYTKGRWITVTGTVTATRAGRVGEASYEFPVVQTDGIHLWTKDNRAPSNTQFHFGIGIGIHR